MSPFIPSSTPQEYSEQQRELMAPPPGYHSTRGVASSNEHPSFFKVTHSICTQRLELCFAGSIPSDQPGIPLWHVLNSINDSLPSPLSPLSPPSPLSPLLSQADEYVVYSPSQQRMRYLVEFTIPDTDSPPSPPSPPSLLGEGEGVEAIAAEPEEDDDIIIMDEGMHIHVYTCTPTKFRKNRRH